MTIVSALVTEAFRVAGIIGVGESPTGNEATEGARRLAVLVQTLIGNELGENIPTLSYGTYNLPTQEAYDQDFSALINESFVPSNVRLVFNNTGAKTLYLDPSPNDGARLQVLDNAGNFGTYNIILNGNGRKIESAASVTLSTNSYSGEWFYRADLGQWVKITDLTSSSESPFPAKYDDFLILLLALRLNPSFNDKTFAPESGAMLSRAERQFKAQYRQEKQVGVDSLLSRVNPYGVAQTTPNL